jgi:allantoin racemase
MRIWIQSNTGLMAEEKWKPYRDAELEHLSQVKGKETEIHLDGVDVMQPDLTHSAMHRFRNTEGLIEKGIKAQAEGYDAFVVIGLALMGREELREELTIPVVFAQEIAWFYASWLYGRFGLLAHDRVMYMRRREQIKATGVYDCFVEGDYADLRKEDTLAAYNGDFDGYYARITEASRRTVHDGAKVLVPDIGPLNALLIHHGVREMHGVPIFDTSGMSLRAAQLMVEAQVTCKNPW